jgi:hypothetical protein
MQTVKIQKCPPVLLIVFNRLEKVQEMFSVLRKVKPSRLYVSADGPRVDRDSDKVNCKLVREYVEQAVDWQCDLVTRFLDENLGCGIGPSSAISWFFDQEEQGVLLEDDCIPHADFFKVAAHFLETSKDDEKVWIINGINYGEEFSPKNDTFFYSKVAQTPSFATWKSVWKNFNFEITDEDSEIENTIRRVWDYPPFVEKWVSKIMSIKYGGRKDIWDEQWVYAMWRNTAYCITPSRNMVQNIGFGEDGTHHSNLDDDQANIEAKGLSSTMLPSQLSHFPDFDKNVFKKIYHLNGKSNNTGTSVKNILKKTIHDLRYQLNNDYKEGIVRGNLLRETPRYLSVNIPFRGTYFEVKDKEDFELAFSTFVKSEFWRSIPIERNDVVIDLVSEVGLSAFAFSKIYPKNRYLIFSKQNAKRIKNNIKQLRTDRIVVLDEQKISETISSAADAHLIVNLTKLKDWSNGWQEDIKSSVFKGVICRYVLKEKEPNVLSQFLSWCEKYGWRYRFVHVSQAAPPKAWKRFYQTEIENISWIGLTKV